MGVSKRQVAAEELVMTQGGAWWDTGFSGFEKAREERERSWVPKRFWIPKPGPGKYNEKDILVLSDDPFEN